MAFFFNESDEVELERGLARPASERTAVVLPLKASAEARSWDMRRLKQFLGRSLCFQKHLQALRLEVDGAAVAVFARTESPARPLPADLKHSPNKFVDVDRLSQSKIQIACEECEEGEEGGSQETWHGIIVVAQLRLNHQQAIGILPGIEAVIGKKLRPRPIVRLLYEDESAELQLSEYSNIRQAVSPLVRAGLFVGFDTALLTGCGFHTSGDFLPTMERTNLDMSHPQIGQWNKELLLVAGNVARAYYNFRMGEMRAEYDALPAFVSSLSPSPHPVVVPWWHESAPLLVEQDELHMRRAALCDEVWADTPLFAKAMRMMQSHQFSTVGVQTEIVECIGPAFWNTAVSRPTTARESEKQILVVSTAGIVLIRSVLLVPANLAGIEKFLPRAVFITDDMGTAIDDFVRRAADDAHALDELSVERAVTQLKQQPPLTPYGATRFLNWYCAMPVDYQDTFEHLIRDILKTPVKKKSIFNIILARVQQDRPLKKWIQVNYPSMKSMVDWLFRQQNKKMFEYTPKGETFRLRKLAPLPANSIKVLLATAMVDTVLNSSTISIHSTRAKHGERSSTISLQSLSAYVGDRMLAGIPLPPSTLPFCIVKHLKRPRDLDSVLELKAISFTDWWAHASSPAQAAIWSYETAVACLIAIKTAVQRESKRSRSEVLEGLGEMQCIPIREIKLSERISSNFVTKASYMMVRPAQAFLIDDATRRKFYGKGWDLPKPELPDEFCWQNSLSRFSSKALLADDFCLSIGVRTEPGVEQILRAAKSSGAPWGLVQIVDYVHSHQEEVTEDDWAALRKEVVDADCHRKRATAVYLPDEHAAALQLPTADLGGAQLTAERKAVMLRMGYKDFVEFDALLALAKKQPKLCRQAFDVLVSRWDECYSDRLSELSQSEQVIVPLRNGRFATVSSCCFAQHPFPIWPSVAPDVTMAVASKLGIREHPPITDCVRYMLSLKDMPQRNMASEVMRGLAYFEDYTNLGHDMIRDEDLQQLRDGQICLTKRNTWVRPATVYEAWLISSYTEHLFDYLQMPQYSKNREDEKMLAFLKRLGMRDRPPIEHIAEALTARFHMIPPVDIITIIYDFAVELRAVDANTERYGEILGLLQVEIQMFPAKVSHPGRPTVYELHCLNDISINDDPDYTNSLKPLLKLAPSRLDGKLEWLYRELGCLYVSDRIEATYLRGDVCHDKNAQRIVETLMRAKHNRRKLLLSDVSAVTEGHRRPPREGLRRCVTEAYVKALKIVCVSSIKKLVRFNRKPVPALHGDSVTRCAFVEQENTIFVCVCDLFSSSWELTKLDFAISMSEALLDRSMLDRSILDQMKTGFETLLFDGVDKLRMVYKSKVDRLIADDWRDPRDTAAVTVQRSIRRHLLRFELARKKAAIVCIQKYYRRRMISHGYIGQLLKDRKTEVGRALYAQILEQNGDPELTGKITGMMLEAYSTSKLRAILSDASLLGETIADATKLLEGVVGGALPWGRGEPQRPEGPEPERATAQSAAAVRDVGADDTYHDAQRQFDEMARQEEERHDEAHAAKDKTHWVELSPTEHAAAERLGWDGEMWNIGETPAESNYDWRELSVQQQVDASYLGYAENSWNRDRQEADDDTNDSDSVELGPRSAASDATSSGEGTESDDRSEVYESDSDSATGAVDLGPRRVASDSGSDRSDDRSRTSDDTYPRGVENEWTVPAGGDDDDSRSEMASVADTNVTHVSHDMSSMADDDARSQLSIGGASFASTMSRGTPWEQPAAPAPKTVRPEVLLQTFQEHDEYDGGGGYTNGDGESQQRGGGGGGGEPPAGWEASWEDGSPMPAHGHPAAAEAYQNISERGGGSEYGSNYGGGFAPADGGGYGGASGGGGGGGGGGGTYDTNQSESGVYSSTAFGNYGGARFSGGDQYAGDARESEATYMKRRVGELTTELIALQVTTSDLSQKLDDATVEGAASRRREREMVAEQERLQRELELANGKLAAARQQLREMELMAGTAALAIAELDDAKARCDRRDRVHALWWCDGGSATFDLSAETNMAGSAPGQDLETAAARRALRGERHLSREGAGGGAAAPGRGGGGGAPADGPGTLRRAGDETGLRGQGRDADRAPPAAARPAAERDPGAGRGAGAEHGARPGQANGDACTRRRELGRGGR
jgi:hypothetical protein